MGNRPFSFIEVTMWNVSDVPASSKTASLLLPVLILIAKYGERRHLVGFSQLLYKLATPKSPLGKSSILPAPIPPKGRPEGSLFRELCSWPTSRRPWSSSGRREYTLFRELYSGIVLSLVGTLMIGI